MKRGLIVAVVIAALIFAGAVAYAVVTAQSQKPAETNEANRSAEQKLEVSDPELGSTPLEDGRITMTLCGSDDTYVRLGESYIEGGCLVHDREEGYLTDRVQITGTVDTSKAGDYKLTYVVQNNAGMVATRERTVHVTDSMEWNSGGVPVLMYHYVYDPSNVPEDVGANHVSTGELEEQLQWLTSEGFYYPSWAELRAYVDGGHSLPAKSVMLTFDDGEYGFLDLGIPLLNKYRVNATSFTECSREDIQHVLTNYASPYVMFESHSFDMHHGGGGQGHGGIIYALDENGLTSDLQQACDILQSKNAFAYPYGDVSDVSRAAIDRVGILCAVTTEFAKVHPGDDYWRLPRVRVSGGNDLTYYQGTIL